MISLNLSGGATEALQVLCLGAHSDDIEIGCGGTIMRMAMEHPNWVFHWVVFSAIGVRAKEAEQSASRFVEPTGPKSLTLKTYRDGFMPFSGAEIKGTFEDLKRSVVPDLIFTHSGKDAHQDHRLISELTWNTFRNHLILEYEIPKYDGDLGRPSVFAPLTKEICDKKVDLIIDSFRSQGEKLWFQPETFRSLMRLRGMECNAPSGYAEAFHGRKLVF